MSDIAENLRRLMEARGVKASPLALKAGLSRSAVSDIIYGRSKRPQIDTLERIAKALGVSVAEITGSPQPALLEPEPAAYRGPLDLPVYASAQGGDDGMLISMEPIEYISRPEYLTLVKDAFAFYIVGDSMEPRFEQGDRVLVNPRRPARPGSDVLIIMADSVGPDHAAMVKRLLSVSRDVVRLRQHNPPRDFDMERKKISSMFKVVGIQTVD